MLVDKYNKGLKAEQYYHDMRKLDQLEEKLRSIGPVKNYNLPKPYDLDASSKIQPEYKAREENNIEVHHKF